MNNQITVDRRKLLAGGMIAGSVASTGLAHATLPSWKNPNFHQIKSLIGETFTAKTLDGKSVPLKLHKVQRAHLGAATPASIRHRHAMTLIFDSPYADEIAQEKGGNTFLKVSHAQLGSRELYLDTEKSKSGRYRFEVNFN